MIAERSNSSPGPEMQIAGRVAAWEPPHRIVFDNGEGAGGLAFEWLIEAGDGDTCVVRLVNTGFGSGEPWDAQYDGMVEGWKLFLSNLRLHLEHFRGQTATSMLPMAMWAGTRTEVWARLTDALGIPAAPAIGTWLRLDAKAAPPLAGTVLDCATTRLVLLLDQPAPGTAFVAVEGNRRSGRCFGLVLPLRHRRRNDRKPGRTALAAMAHRQRLTAAAAFCLGGLCEVEVCRGVQCSTTFLGIRDRPDEQLNDQQGGFVIRAR